MKQRLALLVFLVLLCLHASTVIAQPGDKGGEVAVPRSYSAPKMTASESLQAILEKAVDETVPMFGEGNFKPNEYAATLIDLSDPANISHASRNGEMQLYTASVVKMFYMAALERQLEDGKITMTPELERGLKDMIVDSSNEATQYVLDVVTGTSSGAELPIKQFEAWQYKRNRVNRFFASMGYTNININQKTFCEDAYGIEQQSRKYKGQNRNMLTTNATARLLAEIVLGRTNTPQRTAKMMELMKRDPFAATTDQEDQAHGFTGLALIERKLTSAKLWSKAGWTSKSRHDAAYIETADGRKFVIVIFTEGHAKEAKFIPTIAGKILDSLKR